LSHKNTIIRIFVNPKYMMSIKFVGNVIAKIKKSCQSEQT
jgi:hypothetical protein